MISSIDKTVLRRRIVSNSTTWSAKFAIDDGASFSDNILKRFNGALEKFKTEIFGSFEIQILNDLHYENINLNQFEWIDRSLATSQLNGR